MGLPLLQDMKIWFSVKLSISSLKVVSFHDS